MRFGNECKDVLWAFTFLGQFGFCCRDLMLTGVGVGGALATVGPVPNPRVGRGRPALIRADQWSGERLGAFLEKIMSEGAHLP